VLRRFFDEAKQEAFTEYIAAELGYDFKRGRQDRAVHPFCQGLSRDDVRITTRFDKNFLQAALFGTMHETGHAMYEQGVRADMHGRMATGTSLGVHESQSRLWENVVGRSRGFWKHYYPILQQKFPESLGDVEMETFYRAVNKSAPSLIRVEADEVTYNMHTLVRFEMENEFIEGKLKVSDAPDAWNAKYKAYLGIVPPTDTLGILQDVHWSGGMMGYFPTYTIGNLLSAQLFEKAVADVPSIPADIEQGKFTSLLGWLNTNVHAHGRKYMPQELVKRVTGESLNSRAYIKYLNTKYGDIYGF
jgi:carboxypeptidase Taq